MPIVVSDSFPEGPDEYDYFSRKSPERIYISKAFDSMIPCEPSECKKMRYISKVFDSQELHQFIEIKREIVLRVTSQQRQEVRVLFYEDPRKIEGLTIQRFTRETGKPHKVFFTFSGEEINKLYNLLRFIKYLRLESEEKGRLDDHILDDLLIDADEKRSYFAQHLDLVQEIVENNITESDVVALAYRKKQLEIFAKLLNDQKFFSEMRVEWNKRGDEAVWQQFFENNPWIFGYGLNYIFTSGLDDRKLEQVTTGYEINQSGKRVDALLKTRGLISSLCFVEIKTHKTPLLADGRSYRPDCWPISPELSGSLSQIQKTVQNAILHISTHMQMHDDDGSPTGESAFLYQPKAYVIVGSLEQFITGHGINEQKFGSFELFRRNIVNPEIITFDELFERAKFIVRHSEDESHPIPTEIEEDEIPF